MSLLRWRLSRHGGRDGNRDAIGLLSQGDGRDVRRDDFIYGPQTWKPTGAAGYPIWIGENVADPANDCLILFVDLYAGIDGQSFGLIDNGNVRVDYHFENLPGLATFNAYGFRVYGGGLVVNDVQWTNKTSGVGSSSFRVFGVNELLSDVYDGYPVSRRSVDGDDLIYMALHAGTTPADLDWDNRCDIEDNDLIDDADTILMLADFGKTY